VTVSTGAPVLQKIKPDSVWIDDDTLYTITAQANPTTALKQRVVQWEAGGKWDTSATDTMRHIYTSAGLKQVTCFVIDNNGTISNIVNKTVLVLLGAPSVASVTIDSALSKIFINDTLHFTVHGFDPNGQIDSIKVSWTGSASAFTQTLLASGNAATFAKAFSSSGPQTIRFRVIDNDGLTVDTTITITVRQGKPVITSIATDTPSMRIFTGQQVKFTVTGLDTNGPIAGMKAAWNNDTTAWNAMVVANSVGILSNTFTSPGTKLVRFRVIDNDGLSTDSVLTVFVHTGRPVVTSITPDSNIFINDTRKFAIATKDSNGTVDSVKIDNGSGSFGIFVKTFNGFDTLNRVFLRSEAGSKTIRVIAKDNDGLLSDTAKLTVTVRLAAPVIDRVSVDTTGNNLFVNDKRTYSVSAHDTNGFVKKIYFNWDGGTSASPAPTDSIVIIRNTASIDTFIPHQYDTTTSGARTLRVWARDDDSIVSINTKDTVVTVRLGRPVLWADKIDTLWTVVDSGWDRSYSIHINSFDTNGVNQKPIRYYWQGSGQPFDSSQADQPAIFRKTNTDTVMWPFPNLGTSNQSRTLWIAGRDDDNLLGGRISGTPFVIFADSAPPAPVVTFAINSSGGVINWRGKDAKDSNQTQYEILVKKGTTDPVEPTDVISQYKAGANYSAATIGGFDFSFSLPTQGSGEYHCLVIAKDARGSVSKSLVAVQAY
jgi:hypothetical protein